MNNRIATLEDVKIDVKIKLAALWTSLMFLYTYGDILGFYTPGNLEQLIAGEIEGIQVTESLLIVNAAWMAIPSIMVFLSVALKAGLNRWANIVMGILSIAVIVATTFVGGIDVRFAIQVGVEIVLIALILWHVWKWPRQEGMNVTP